MVTSIQTNNGASKIQDLTYKWLSNGSMESRTNNKSGTAVVDNFTYDDLDRLKTTDTKIGSALQRTLTQNYNSLGNILSNTSSVTGDTQVENYLYQTATSTRPHAISSATINGISYSFTYDANGAITVYDAAGTNPDKFIAYNAANQPTKITVGTSLNDANPIARDEFRYTPDGARYYKKTTYKESTRLRTEYTLYIGDYETTYFDTFSALKQSEKSQVGSAILNIRKTPYSGLITDDVEVLHRDHLGSVDAVTVSTATVANLAFEPFGARRSSTLLTNATTTEMTNILAKTDVLNSKGYTGHESLDRTGLIHMNGRVYDPQLGRFLSPDPLVQSPANSQSWNRYSYVFNNPLKYTDPTGFETEPKVEEITVTGIEHKRPSYDGSYTGDRNLINTLGRNASNNYFTPTNTSAGSTDILQKSAFGMGGNGASCEDVGSIACELMKAASPEEIALQKLVDEVEKNGFLSSEVAGQIMSLNKDPNLTVSVKADMLVVKQTGEFYRDAKTGKMRATGHVVGVARAVHGQVTLAKRKDGTIGILNGRYDFEMHKVSSPMDVVRNALTVVGAVVAGSGTGFDIRYTGNANVIPLRE